MNENEDRILADIQGYKEEIAALNGEIYFLNNQIQAIEDKARDCNEYGGCKVWEHLNMNFGGEW